MFGINKKGAPPTALVYALGAEEGGKKPDEAFVLCANENLVAKAAVSLTPTYMGSASFRDAKTDKKDRNCSKWFYPEVNLTVTTNKEGHVLKIDTNKMDSTHAAAIKIPNPGNPKQYIVLKAISDGAKHLTNSNEVKDYNHGLKMVEMAVYQSPSAPTIIRSETQTLVPPARPKEAEKTPTNPLKEARGK